MPRAGIEPTTLALGVPCSVHLSYRSGYKIIPHTDLKEGPAQFVSCCLLFNLSAGIVKCMYPEKIGRYKIKAELGRGGMATVYRHYDPIFEKVLPEWFTANIFV